MNSECVKIGFRSDDQNFDWKEVVSNDSVYEFTSPMKFENKTNANWSRWAIIINYKRNKNVKN